MTSEQLAIKNVGKQASLVSLRIYMLYGSPFHSYFMTFSAVLALFYDHWTLHANDFVRKSMLSLKIKISATKNEFFLKANMLIF